MQEAPPELRRRDALQFSHMGFHVRDLARMERYYVDVLCFTVTDRGNLGAIQLVFLSRDPTEHHQVVLVSGRPDGQATTGINQISFRVPDVKTLRMFRDRAVADAGTSDLVAVTHGNAVSIYFRDPEGNRLEVFFDTPWYCEQPMREPVDLDRTDDEVLAQAEALARKQPRFVDRADWVRDMARRMGYAE